MNNDNWIAPGEFSFSGDMTTCTVGPDPYRQTILRGRIVYFSRTLLATIRRYILKYPPLFWMHAGSVSHTDKVYELIKELASMKDNNLKAKLFEKFNTREGVLELLKDIKEKKQ